LSPCTFLLSLLNPMCSKNAPRKLLSVQECVRERIEREIEDKTEKKL